MEVDTVSQHEGSASERYGQKAYQRALKSESTPMSIVERLQAQLRRGPKDRVLVKHVAGPSYRANWYVPVTADETGLIIVGTWELDQSHFLSVTEEKGQLTVVNKTRD